MKQGNKSKSVVITSVLCLTIAIISVIGGLIYIQKQDIAQKNRDLQQQKELKEYEQEQLNKRNQEDNDTLRRNSLDDRLSDDNNPFTN